MSTRFVQKKRELQQVVFFTAFLSSASVQQDAGSQQIGFLLGSCGVAVALTSDACHKGLPKSATGEIPQFKGDCQVHQSLQALKSLMGWGVGGMTCLCDF